MEAIKKYLKENYVAKKNIEELIKELYCEFHRLDEEIDIYDHTYDKDGRVFAMQEIGYIVGKLETLIGKE